jgi:4-amino-4-deoxy-L-arabinose transferase-like glycosyltransferase
MKSHTFRAALILTLIWLVLFVMRLTGPVDLVTRDQGLSLAYMVDIETNGHWLYPVDHFGDPASKPPLHSMLGALSILLFGHTWFAAALPSALATLATTLWILVWGGKRLGSRVGQAAAGAYLLCHLTVALLPVVRSDALFTFLVVVAVTGAFDAWRGWRSWWLFWTAATMASMTKGPLGLLLPAVGLLATVWMNPGQDRPTRSERWGGALLYLAVVGGWFTLGWLSLGRVFVDEVLWQELVGHSLRSDQGETVLVTFWQPTAHLLTRFLPWTPLLVLAIWKVFRRPAPEIEGRALERFMTALVLSGVVILSLVGHKRGDLVAPLLPAAAILVGRELTRATTRWPLLGRAPTPIVVTLTLVMTFSLYHHHHRRANRWVAYSDGHWRFAGELKEKVADPERLEFTSGWFHVQYRLGTLKRPLPARDGVRALAGVERLWIVASPVEDLTRPATRREIDFTILLSGQQDIALVSNSSNLP